MSRILLVIDGMTDPLFDPAKYPYLSSLKPAGGIDTVLPGHAVESLPCILTLLGVSSIPIALRGYAEALGAGLAVNEDDLVLRASWVEVDGKGSCAGYRDAPEGFLPGRARYHPLGGYKALLVLPGAAGELARIVTHPPHTGMGKPACELLPEGCAALRSVVEQSRKGGALLLPWGQSRPVALAPFPERAAVVCGADIVRGIARLLEMELVPVLGATGDTDTDLEAKTSAALRAAEDFDFVLLHLNGADEAAHRRDRGEKERFLRAADELVLRPLIASGHALRVASDHGSDPETGLHVGGVQPIYEK